MSELVEHGHVPQPGDEDLESHISRHRGKHKVFLGYAPGVGKTYTMLAEAHRRRSRGEDIVIGFVEPHDRPETTELAEGIEKVPTKKIEYRGNAFEEMDTEAVIARKPEWALVDELAHTNVPGTEHQKRWQSVEDILEAGINVISTVNVQHMESLNDIIAEITGVRVRETLPDNVVDDADEVVLVDLTPDALRNRLQRGVVYAPEKVPQALKQFFRPGNLTALRELALRTAAEEVDEDLMRYMDEHAIKEAWAARDRVLAAVSDSPMAPTLVRRAYRLAKSRDGLMWVLVVRTGNGKAAAGEDRWLTQAREVADSVGASIVEVTGESAAEEIIRFAEDNHVSLIVLGQSARTRFEEVMKGSIVNRIMRETTGIDVVVVADPERGGRKPGRD